MNALNNVAALEAASKSVRLARLEREAWQDLYGRLAAAVEAAQNNAHPSRVALTELLTAFTHAARGLARARLAEERVNAELRDFLPSC